MAEDAEARRQSRKEWMRRKKAEFRAKQRGDGGEERAAAEPTEAAKQRDALRKAEQKAKRKAAREERAAFNKRFKERLVNEQRQREQEQKQEQARNSHEGPASRRVAPDPFSILGLARGATREQVKAAYRGLALQYHPDRPGGDAGKFTEVNDAYLQCLKLSGLSLAHPT